MKSLNVRLDFRGAEYAVGRLFLSDHLGRYVFQYDPNFLAVGLEISPYVLPLGAQTYVADRNPDLYNLHSPFADALPDEWGKWVQDAEFEKTGNLEPTALERLSFIGGYGLGALQFHPEQSFSGGLQAVDLADLRKASQHILDGRLEEVVEQLLKAGGSAGGARPKYLVDMKSDVSGRIRYTTGELEDGWTPVILKIAGKDGDHWQRIEHSYFQMAVAAGLNTPETWLLTEGSEGHKAHFAIRRFDIDEAGGRFHMQTFAGLLGVDFRRINLDYSRLLRTVDELCRDKIQLVEAYRRLIFNYLGGNKDDHSKNFSFLMDRRGRWYLSPAYDLSYSTGDEGMHIMSAVGKRRNLLRSDFGKIANDFGIKKWELIIDEVQSALMRWPEIAAGFEVPEKYIRNIRQRIRENLNRL